MTRTPQPDRPSRLRTLLGVRIPGHTNYDNTAVIQRGPVTTRLLVSRYRVRKFLTDLLVGFGHVQL